MDLAVEASATATSPGTAGVSARSGYDLAYV